MGGPGSQPLSSWVASVRQAIDRKTNQINGLCHTFNQVWLRAMRIRLSSCFLAQPKAQVAELSLHRGQQGRVLLHVELWAPADQVPEMCVLLISRDGLGPKLGRVERSDVRQP
jgi:hypothetical protein